MVYDGKFLINTKQTKLVTEYYVRCVLDACALLYIYTKYETYVAKWVLVYNNN